METLTGWDGDVARVLDLAGVFAFAVSGALLAVRKHYDVVGLTVLALVTALGGGTLRDVLLGDIPPQSLASTTYLVVPLVAAALVFVGHDVIERRLRTSVLVFDAAGLGLFCVTGALKALAFGAPAVAAVLLGAITATGGGVIRDTLAGEDPVIFRSDSVLYSVPAAFGLVRLAGGDPWRAGLLAANIGDDTDTIGAIACAMAGACAGAGSIPAEARRVLEAANRLELDEVAEGLLALRVAEAPAPLRAAGP